MHRIKTSTICIAMIIISSNCVTLCYVVLRCVHVKSFVWLSFTCKVARLLCDSCPDDFVLVVSENPLQDSSLCSRMHLSAGGGGHGGG